MNKTTFLALLSIFVVALFVVGIVYNNGAKDVIEDSAGANIEDKGSINPASGGAEEEDIDVPEQNDVQEYTFTNEYGDGEKSVKIEAKKTVRLSGFSGANSNVYYIDIDNNLYHLELANLTKKKLATNIKNIESEYENIIAYFNTSYEIISDDDYVVYKKMS